MNRKRLLVIIAGLLAIAGIIALIISKNSGVSENEISLQIQLDVNEDIGLLIIDSDFNGEHESGGVSSADKSMLKKDELLYWSIDREFHEGLPDTVDLTLKFRVVTEYCDPNYENIYPEELVMPMNEVSLSAAFGQTYHFKITGDNVKGYHVDIID